MSTKLRVMGVKGKDAPARQLEEITLESTGEEARARARAYVEKKHRGQLRSINWGPGENGSLMLICYVEGG